MILDEFIPNWWNYCGFCHPCTSSIFFLASAYEISLIIKLVFLSDSLFIQALHSCHFLTSRLAFLCETRRYFLMVLVLFYGLKVCVETMMHLTCTNMPVEKLENALDTIKKNGIQNVLALRGDPPHGQDKFVQVEGGFACALDLVCFASFN